MDDVRDTRGGRGGDHPAGALDVDAAQVVGAASRLQRPGQVHDGVRTVDELGDLG
jgi:hypothetical protein